MLHFSVNQLEVKRNHVRFLFVVLFSMNNFQKFKTTFKI